MYENSLPNYLDYFFLDEVVSSKLNLHGGSFRKYGHLGLFEAKHTYVCRLSVQCNTVHS